MPMNVIKRIEVFGDSILKGIQVNPCNKHYCVDNHIDIARISEKHMVSIENNSKFGCTITKGARLLDKHLARGVCCDTVVMDFGGNDCDFVWSDIAARPLEEHQPHTPIKVFVRIYHEIIQKLKAQGIQPILTTLPPLEPQRFFDWFCRDIGGDAILQWLGSVSTIYRYQERYSREVEAIAREEGVPIVDLRGAFLKSRHIEHLLCEDGIHPNTAGQRVITATFMEFADGVARKRRAGAAPQMA